MPPTPTARFLAAFNRIDAAMRKMTGLTDKNKSSFSAVLKRYSETCYFEDAGFLRLVTDLRNLIVHNNLDAAVEFTTPALSVVTKLERIANEIDKPENVGARIATVALTMITPLDSIKHILDLIQEKHFSQFPVVEDGKITGLLTENGIARWLSSEVAKESLIDFADAKVAEVLAHEEKRENMILISKLRVVAEVRMKFIQNPLLEAAIITEAGKPDQQPLGILTRWDFI